MSIGGREALGARQSERFTAGRACRVGQGGPPSPRSRCHFVTRAGGTTLLVTLAGRGTKRSLSILYLEQRMAHGKGTRGWQVMAVDRGRQ